MVAQQNVGAPKTLQNDKVTVEVPMDIIWHFIELKDINLAYYIDSSSSRVYALDGSLDALQISVYSLPAGSLEDAVRHILKSLRRPNYDGVNARVGIFEREPDEIKKICVPAVGEECIEKVRKLELRPPSGLSL